MALQDLGASIAKHILLLVMESTNIACLMIAGDRSQVNRFLPISSQRRAFCFMFSHSGVWCKSVLFLFSFLRSSAYLEHCFFALGVRPFWRACCTGPREKNSQPCASFASDWFWIRKLTPPATSMAALPL